MINEREQALEQAIKEVVGLGRVWARTGLDLAKKSLEASSASIGAAAKLVGELSRSLEDEATSTPPTPEAPSA